jgi:2-polyprenyl-3-methyl-5-hydroxy-6-metoxy-1,4-benzoquinol methylase
MINGNLRLIELFAKRYLRPGISVLDVGSNGEAAYIFSQKQCVVTALSYGDIPSSPEYCKVKTNLLFFDSDDKFDAIWCSHVLEHISNVNIFLRKMISCAKSDASIGVVVPLIKDVLVGGHINLFTPGTLCYSIVLAGQDLSQATVIQYKNNICVFWKRRDIYLPTLKYDKGDLEILSSLFPLPVCQDIQATTIWSDVRSDDFDRDKNNFADQLEDLARDSNIEDRFKNAEMLWHRYSRVIEHAKSMGYKKGLDFGPGSCPGLIAGKLLGVDVSGIDIPICRGLPNRFHTIHQHAIQKGFNLTICDTDLYPWAFDSDSFDFVLCFDALFVDWKQHIDWKVDPSRCLSRINEMLRILKNGGGFYIGGGGGMGLDADFVKLVSFSNLKSIKFFKWEFASISQIL